ncbi:putative receptor-like protein kinase HAIKU2-like protein, partial [Tanacetum coccineum]
FFGGIRGGCGYLAEADPEILIGSGHWARAAVHIFNRISFAIAKGVRAQIISRLPFNLLMEDSGFSFQWPVNSIDDQLSSIVAVGENMCRVNADVPLFEYYEPVIEPSPRASKQLKTHSMNQNLIHGSDFGIVNRGTLVKPKDEAFASSSSYNSIPSPGSGNQNYYSFTEACHGDSSGAKVAPASNSSRISPYQDHILAERKRREKLSQSFIALSALLPNLKKLDKVSVLGDAIEYMKTLQEKVKKLEEQTPETNRKSVIFEMVTDDVDNSSSDEKLSCLSDQLPEIEARFSGKDVLIRVYCVKKLGAVEKTLVEIEKLHLSVISSTAIIFANSALHITVIAQMDKDLSMTMKDLDLKESIVKGLGLQSDDLKISGFDSRDALVGRSVAYEFDVEIDDKVLPFKLLEDVNRWEYVDLPIFRVEEQARGVGDENGLVEKKGVGEKLPVLAPFQLAGPMELWIQDAKDMRLSLPHDVDAGELRKVILADGAVVTVKGARSVSLRHPIELPLPLNNTKTGFASGLLTLAELRNYLPVSKTNSNNRRHFTIDLHGRSPNPPHPTISPHFGPVNHVNGSHSKPTLVLENLLGLEKLLGSVLGSKASTEGSFKLLKADISAHTFVKIGFGVERKLTGNLSELHGQLPEWRTKPETMKMHFEVLAKVDGNKFVPERVVQVNPVPVEHTVAPSVATKEIQP